MAPCGMERSVPISTYCSPAANSNICHPLNVHLGKHQVQGARVPLPSPCFNGLCQHGMWEGKKGIAKEVMPRLWQGVQIFRETLLKMYGHR